MPKYSEKLRDPRWQKRRLQILERDRWTCQSCGSTDKTLHVHHSCYVDGYEPWDSNPDTLVTLCLDCHFCEPEKQRDAQYWLLILLGRFGVRTAEDIIRLSMACDLANGEINLRFTAESLAVELMQFEELKADCLAKGGWNA